MAESAKLHIGVMVVGLIGPLLILGLILRNSLVDVWTIVGLAIFIPSLILWATAQAQLGRSFSVRARARELVTGGIYSKIRHPIYIFGLLLLLSFIVCLRKPIWLILWGMLVVMQVARARKEERVLEAKFGDTYRDYKKKTWF
ncbi:MAG: methyltransferase family protein [Candidatus Aminicenantales bacterium]